MLVVTRREGDSIKIDGGITVHVIETKRCEVRIGIDAPDDVKIFRSELVEEKNERVHATRNS
jgi:carbon storage regulator